MGRADIKALEEQLLYELSFGLAKHGFKRKARDQSFYKPTAFGRVAFHISFVKHKYDFDVTADVAIRVDELEDLINEFNDRLTKAEKRQTFTIGAELGNIADGREKRWTVTNASDILEVAASILSAFETVGLPYLEKYSSLEAILEVLSKNDRLGWLHSPIHGARCERAVGLAFLLGKNDELDELVTRNEIFLRENNDFGLESFKRFVKALEQKRAQMNQG